MFINPIQEWEGSKSLLQPESKLNSYKLSQTLIKMKLR